MTEPGMTHVVADDQSIESALKGAAPIPGALPNPEPAENRRLHVRTSGEFVRARREKLSYQISMLGVPVGNAVLEATNNNGELRITSSAKSNATISFFYPIDNATETRMFSGRYVTTTIRQREGRYQRDIGFTLCFSEKNIFWADRLKKRYTNQPMPNEDVLDVITGFYFLRNQSLEVGRTLVLNLFDSNAYAPTTVHILRRERVKLPGLREADTLVIRPELRTDGFFRRAGEVLVWLTDDDYKVPVRLETTIDIGRVTAELVSAEAEQ